MSWLVSAKLIGQGSFRRPREPHKTKDCHLQLDGSVFKRQSLPPRAKGAPKSQGSPQGPRANRVQEGQDIRPRGLPEGRATVFCTTMELKDFSVWFFIWVKAVYSQVPNKQIGQNKKK